MRVTPYTNRGKDPVAVKSPKGVTGLSQPSFVVRVNGKESENGCKWGQSKNPIENVKV